MQAIISNTLMRSLAPGAKPYEVRDTRLKGFLLRVQPSGVASFYVEFGRGRRCRLGRADALKPDAARKRAKEMLALAYQGVDPRESAGKAKAHTLGSFIDEVYAPWAEAHIRTAKGTVGRLKASFRDWRGKPLTEITPWLVEKWRTARLRAGVKPTTVNRDLADLKSSLSKAAAWGIIESNPISGVKRCRVDSNARVRFLSEDEEERLLSALDHREAKIRKARARANAWRRDRDYPLLPEFRETHFADHLKPMVLLSLHTGLRRGELFGLVWENVDLPRATLTVIGANAKSGRTRHVPLNTTAISVLTSWQPEPEQRRGLVFSGKTGKAFNNTRKSWLGVLEAATVRDFRWHDMRHTFASRLVMAAIDLNTVRELLGHSDYAMTLRYAHLAPEHRAAAVAKLVS